MKPPENRKWAQGAEVLADGAVSFRVWAPEHHRVEVVLQRRAGRPHQTASAAATFDDVRPLREAGGGYWGAVFDDVRAGDRYRYRLGGEPPDLPDPAARYLPEGPHGAAEVVDPRSFRWSDTTWTGLSLTRQSLYELHVGTFSPEGTWEGAMARLPLLRDLGITALEVMPVSEYAGRFGWGYDGVAWFAPSRLYGTPDQFRAFVDRAHALGLGVLLDVVYNHFGPVGDYTARFSRHYVAREKTEWGAAVNYDSGPEAAAVRALAVDNAAYWIDEFHLDGLRLDATQSIQDRSTEHVITAIARAARGAAGGRRLLLIGENEPQDARLLRTHAEIGVGSGLDALWNDDFHHCAHVALTGRAQAYFSDFTGDAREWIATTKHGFLYQGQRSAWQKHPRGHSARGLPMNAFVAFIENHDQIANSLWGTRLWQQSSAAQHRAMTALLLLGPWTPLLFQGQEWNSEAPFFYFADHETQLAAEVSRGRADFLSQFPGYATGEARARLRDPADADTFESSRLRWGEREQPEHAAALRLHTDLLRLRRDDPTLGINAPAGVTLDATVLGPSCGVVRLFVDGPVGGTQARDRLLLVNLGADLRLERPAEPLLAPPAEPAHARWRMAWSSEDPSYGGHGCAEPDGGESGDCGWLIPGAAAVLLIPVPSV